MIVGIPLQLQAGVRVLRCQRVASAWRLWVSYNPTGDYGTFIQLGDNGSVTRVTIHEDRTEQEFEIKGEDR